MACRVIARLEASLRDSHAQLAAQQLEKQGVDNALKESTARESVYSSQLRQLTAAHEQQAGSLRREVELRKGFEDEVQVSRQWSCVVLCYVRGCWRDGLLEVSLPFCLFECKKKKA